MGHFAYNTILCLSVVGLWRKFFNFFIKKNLARNGRSIKEKKNSNETRGAFRNTPEITLFLRNPIKWYVSLLRFETNLSTDLNFALMLLSFVLISLYPQALIWRHILQR